MKPLTVGELLTIPDLLRREILEVVQVCEARGGPCRVSAALTVPIYGTEFGPSLYVEQIDEVLSRIVSCEQLCPALTSALALFSQLKELEIPVSTASTDRQASGDQAA